MPIPQSTVTATPTPTPTPKAPAQRQTPASAKLLVWLTLAVAVVHLALLQGVPEILTNFRADSGTATDAPAFNTRMIAPEPVSVSVSVSVPVSVSVSVPVSVPPAVPAPKLAANPPATTRPEAPKPAAMATPTPAPSAELPGQDSTSPASSNAPTDTAPPQTATDATASDSATVTSTSTTTTAAAPSTHAASAPATSTASGTPAKPASAQVAQGADTKSSPAEPPPKMALPPSMRLLYDVKGVVTYAYTGGSELLWVNQGNGYNARLQITKFGFNLRTWTSRGDLTAQGLAPLRFGDKTRSEIASHFQRDKGIVSFSANTPDTPLLPGAQDYLSSFFQLAGMLAGEPQRYPPGTLIAFQVVNARSAEPWVFRVDGPQTVELPDGPKPGIKLTREHDAQYDTKVELWLAPDLSYAPIRIRLSQGNGDFAELLWRSAQKPD